MDPMIGVILAAILSVEMAIVILWVLEKTLERAIEKEEDAETKPKWYWKIAILSGVALGFLTIIPWHNTRANFLGYYSFCTFVPFGTFAMFNISLALYAFAKKSRKTLYGTALILLAILGFTTWWFLDFKSPMDTLQPNMIIRSFWVGTSRLYDGEENLSYVSFYLTLRNPTSRDSPVFLVEPRYIAINNKKLTSGVYLGSSNGSVYWYGFKWFYQPMSLKPQENITLIMEARIRYEDMGVEGASREDMWASLMQRNFTLSMALVLTVRPFFTFNENSYPTVEHESTWAARFIVVSQEYS